MPSQIFVNVAVKDLDRSMEFFQVLGFGFNDQFTNDQAACFVIADNIFVMLLTEEFFQTFTKKELVDTTRATEVLNALSCESREDVDMMLEKGIAAGGSEAREPQDQESMYSRALEDLDGHGWEFFWMDETAAENGPSVTETE